MDESYQFHDPETFMQVVNRPGLQADEKPLFTATKRDDAEVRLSKADGTGNTKAEQLEGHKAVYNPESGRIFGAVTDDYEIVNPPQFFGPLVEVMKERDRTDVAGEFTIRDGGAQGYGTILYDSSTVYPPGRSKQNPVKTGFQFRWSHDGGVSVRASGFAQDTACRNSMRRITDSVYVKHSGDVKQRVDFKQEWETLMNQLGAFNENLVALIADAQDVELFDLDGSAFNSDWIESLNTPSYFHDEDRGVNVPTFNTQRDAEGLFGLYDLLGLPAYLATSACDRLMWRQTQASNALSISAWDAYSAGTYALTHATRATPGTGADDAHHRHVSDLLMNPHEVVSQCEREAQQRVRPDDDQELLIADDLGERAEQYHDRRRQLEETFSGE